MDGLDRLMLPHALVANPGVGRAARVTQGVILYVEAEWADFWPTFLRALDSLLQRPWAQALTTVRHWNASTWRPWNEESRRELLTDLVLRGPVTYSKFEIVDVPNLSGVGVDWQIIPPTRGTYARVGYVRVRLPIDASPQELLDVADILAGAIPVQQGRGGYLCQVDEKNRRIGFDQAWLWARRYYGIDIVDAVEETWDATRALLGVNWLTILGERWLNGPLSDIRLGNSNLLNVRRTGCGGVVLQAGPRPILGDQNHCDDLSAYAAAAIAIRSALIDAPTGFPGKFDDKKTTPQWIRRFLEPEEWGTAV